VDGRVERRELVAEGEGLAVALDDVGDVVALERLGEGLEGPADHVAGREAGRVVVDLEGLVVAGDQEDAEVGLLPDRGQRPHGVEVRVRVVLDGPVPEEVRLGQLPHGFSMTSK
jgi:hypothetical protein